DDARQHAEYAAFSTRRHKSGRRRLWIQAAITRTAFRPEHTRLSFKAKDRAIDVGFAGQHAGIVDEIARREIIRAVNNDVVIAEQLKRVLARQARLVGFNL